MTDNTLKTVWPQAVKKLKESGAIETPVADARLLVQHVLNLGHEDLLMQGNRVVTAEETSALDAVLARRMKREPVSRIVGHRAFWKSDFIVTPATLDPRADSETLIEAALAHVQPGKGGQPLRVLDLGTGTGCLLLSLLLEWPKATGTGLDISAGAAEVAKRNAEAIGVAARAEIVATDWNDYKPAAPFDVVVSNPPYIGRDEAPDLAPEVVEYDPPQALFADENGLAAYRSILARLPELLRAGGWLLLEIGYRQEEAVKALLADAGLEFIETRLDLGGNPRILTARRPVLQ